MLPILTSSATLPGEKPHVQYPKQYLPLSSSRRSQMPPCFPSENPYTVWVNLVKVASLMCESDPGTPRRGTWTLNPLPRARHHTAIISHCAGRLSRTTTRIVAIRALRWMVPVVAVPSQTVAVCARRRLRCEGERRRCRFIQKPPRLRCPVKEN